MDELIAQLVAARTIIDNALRMVSEQAAACQHPNKTDLSPFGATRQWHCPDCGARWEETNGE